MVSFQEWEVEEAEATGSLPWGPSGGTGAGREEGALKRNTPSLRVKLFPSDSKDRGYRV